MTSEAEHPRAWIVSADMGLGHQRAAHSLAYLGDGEVLTAGSPELTDEDEARVWGRFSTVARLASPTQWPAPARSPG